MTEALDDVNEQVKVDWKAQTTPVERVYEIAEQTHDRQSAAEIADQALVNTRHDRPGRSNDAVQAKQRPNLDVSNPPTARESYSPRVT